MKARRAQALLAATRALLAAHPVDEARLYETVSELIARHGHTKAELVRELPIGKRFSGC